MDINRDKILSIDEIQTILDRVASKWDKNYVYKLRVMALKAMFSKENVFMVSDVLQVLFGGIPRSSGFRVFRFALNEILRKNNPPIMFYVDPNNAPLIGKNCCFVRVKDIPKTEKRRQARELMEEMITRLKRIEKKVDKLMKSKN